MERSSAALIVKEMQNKAISPLLDGYHQQKTRDNKSFQGCDENSSALLVGMRNGAATMENRMDVTPKK